MKPKTMSIEIDDFKIKGPSERMAQLLIAGLLTQALPPAANVQPITAHSIPVLGEYWPGQGGFNGGLVEVEAFLPSLGAKLNPTKTILQPVDRGVDFVGHIIKLWRRSTRKRSLAQAKKRTAAAPAEDLRETANSYFGLLSQASHSQRDRAALARVVRKRGHAVNGSLTKTYPRVIT